MRHTKKAARENETARRGITAIRPVDTLPITHPRVGAGRVVGDERVDGLDA
jgi:hypothetical protein